MDICSEAANLSGASRWAAAAVGVSPGQRPISGLATPSWAGPTRVSSNLRDASFQIEDTVQPGWLLAEGHGDGRPGAADVIR